VIFVKHRGNHLGLDFFGFTEYFLDNLRHIFYLTEDITIRVNGGINPEGSDE